MGITIQTINSAIGGMKEKGLSEKTIAKQARFLGRGIREGTPNVKDAVKLFVNKSLENGDPTTYLRAMKVLRVLAEGETSSPQVQEVLRSACASLLIREKAGGNATAILGPLIQTNKEELSRILRPASVT